MNLTVALAQCPTGHPDATLPYLEHFCQLAKLQGAQLLVLPEMTTVTSRKGFAAEATDGPTVRAVADMARGYGMWILHCQDEASADPRRPYNTAVLLDDGGAVRASYRKTHLYDAHGQKESDRYTAGTRLADPVETPWGKLGLGICYELRFPEVTRTAALAGARIMVFPAAWVDGPRKLDHWRTLLAARAIENQMFVVGCCRPHRHKAEDHLNWIGHSMVVDPLGQVIAEARDGEELLTASLELDDVGAAREAMPIFQHRRSELY